jgi:hypothetical protein
MFFERIMPGERIPGAKHGAGFGTTLKVVVFTKHFGVRDPMTRGQRRKLRLRLMAVEREAQGREPVSPDLTQPKDRPRHSSGIQASTSPSPIDLGKIDPELSQVIRTLGDTLSAKWEQAEQAEDSRMMDTVLTARRSRSPPH